MRTEYYEILHKWPHGFKKELCIFYKDKNREIFKFKGHKSPYCCAICGSTNRVSIHHYSSHRGIRAQYIDPETEKVDFKDYSKYIPLCQSWHGTFESLQESFSKGDPPILQFLFWYMEQVHKENGYWNKKEKED